MKIDQSHCNYQLSKWLGQEGWEILFRDPGRVSRGLSGPQEALLGVFERNGWPIPDIVAAKDGLCLFVEVDHRPQVTISSFNTYRSSKTAIISNINATDVYKHTLTDLLTGFCKIGAIRDVGEALINFQIDFLFWFENPMKPSAYCCNHSTCFTED